MLDRIYCDYNATTPVHPEVLDAMLPYFSDIFANASSIHRSGKRASAAVEHARRQIAGLIDAPSEDGIIFTSGATEAINLGIKGLIEPFSEEKRIILSFSDEHSAVLDTLQYIQKKNNCTVYLDDLPASQRPLLIVRMKANNETGRIYSMDEWHNRSEYLFSDLTQAAGKIPVSVQKDKIHLAAFSAHKLYGPKGIGALWISRRQPRVRIEAQLQGGGHEQGFRSGTLNVASIVGFGKACALAKQELEQRKLHVERLRNRFEAVLKEKIEKIHVLGGDDRLPNTSSILFPIRTAASMLQQMPWLEVSTGSACHAGDGRPSHVYLHEGLSKEQAMASIRFSFGLQNTEDDIDRMVGAIVSYIEQNPSWNG